MKKITQVMICALFGALPIQAADLDGTAAVHYESSQYTFSDGDAVDGFVHLAAGCIIPDTATVIFNTPVLQRGSFDCGADSVIELASNLHLDSGVSFPSGATINGSTNTVFLYGNLSVPQGKQIQITSNTTIDGLGHTLSLGGESDDVMSGFFINGSTNTTLRLRNMTITGLKSLTTGEAQNPFVFGAAAGQRVIFENVKLVLSDDTTFADGRLIVEGNLVIDGQKHFIYTSSENLRINDDSTLALELGTWFEYEPSDEKDSHFKFGNNNSRLVLNGATLYAPLSTGLKLQKGALVVDYRSTIRQDASSAEQLGSPSKPITLGSSDENLDLTVWVAPSAVVELINGFIDYNEEA